MLSTYTRSSTLGNTHTYIYRHAHVLPFGSYEKTAIRLFKSDKIHLSRTGITVCQTMTFQNFGLLFERWIVALNGYWIPQIETSNLWITLPNLWMSTCETNVAAFLWCFIGFVILVPKFLELKFLHLLFACVLLQLKMFF